MQSPRALGGSIHYAMGVFNPCLAAVHLVPKRWCGKGGPSRGGGFTGTGAAAQGFLRRDSAHSATAMVTAIAPPIANGAVPLKIPDGGVAIVEVANSNV